MANSATDGAASVVVVTWNAVGMLPACIDSLVAQADLPAPLEIVVVDNGSSDGTLDMLATRYPLVRVVALPENLGFTGGANAGIAAATGEFVSLINNDAVADPHFVSRTIEVLREHPEAGAVTGLILLDGQYVRAERRASGSLVSAEGAAWVRGEPGIRLVNSTGGEVTNSANDRDHDWLVPLAELTRQSGPVPGFSGGAVTLRRAALDQAGVFDERLFMYYEDSDLSWRMRRAGWLVLFERTAVVVHQHAASSGTATPFFLFHNERNRLLFAVKHAPAPVIARAFTRTLVGAASSTVTRNWSRARRKLRAVWSTLKLSPAFLADRRTLDRAASVSRGYLWRTTPRG